MFDLTFKTDEECMGSFPRCPLTSEQPCYCEVGYQLYIVWSWDT